MKPKLSEELKEIVTQGTAWAKLELEYLKLTATEKAVVLSSTMIIGAVMLFLFLPLFIMLLFSLADFFKMLMVPALAYLCVAGIVFILMVLLYALKKPLVIDPVSRFITKLFIDAKSTK